MRKPVSQFALLFWGIALLATLVWAKEETAAPGIPPSEAQIRELKRIGVLVGGWEAWDRVEKAWRSFLERAKDVDASAAVNCVTEEASLEAARNRDVPKKRLDQLNVLKRAVIEELSGTRAVLSDAQQQKKRTMVTRHEFEVTQTEPFRVIAKPRGVLSFEAEVAQYVRDLEANLRSIDVDVRRATAELGAMTQRRDDVMKSLPETREKLLEIRMKGQNGVQRQ